MFKILILICAVGIDRHACSPVTADSVAAGPKNVGVLECGLFGQAQLAPTALAPEPGRQYLKIECVPTSSLEAAAR